MTALQKIARLRTKKHRKLMQSLRCLFMMPYGVYCDTLHRLRSVQSLQLPLFLKVVLSLQHFGHFVKGFCRQKRNITTLSQLQLVVAHALHGLPTGGASLQGHVAVGGAFLGQAYRAGVQVKAPLPEVCPCGHMGVTVEQNIPRGKGRQMVQVEYMAVGDVDQPLPCLLYTSPSPRDRG